MCPECGGSNLRSQFFDFGICSQTGYHDCGESFQCLECGATGDPDEVINLNTENLIVTGETAPSLDECECFSRNKNE